MFVLVILQLGRFPAFLAPNSLLRQTVEYDNAVIILFVYQ